jgi:hypothetical protein
MKKARNRVIGIHVFLAADQNGEFSGLRNNIRTCGLDERVYVSDSCHISLLPLPYPNENERRRQGDFTRANMTPAIIVTNRTEWVSRYSHETPTLIIASFAFATQQPTN